MSEFNALQYKTIQEYRVAHKLGYVVSDEAIAEKIIAEMKANGVSYAGFESLTTIKKTDSNSDNESLFGFGFEAKEENPWGFEKKKENKPKKTFHDYPVAEYNEAMVFAQEYLLSSATKAYDVISNHKKDIGLGAEAIYQGAKNFLNIFDRNNKVKTLNETISYIENEKAKSEKIADIDTKQKGAFEFQFKQIRGVDFNVEKVQDFKVKSEKYILAQACKNQYEILEKGIKELQGLLIQEKQLEQFGQNIVSNEERKSFDTRFVEILDQYCNGDENMRNEIITQISQNISSKDELEKEFMNVLEKLKNNSKALYDSQMDGKSFEQYHQEYVTAYEDTFGGENAEDFVNAWIIEQQNGAQFIKIAAIIAATTFTGGSNLLAQGASSLASKVGPTIAQQIIKFGITMEGVGVGVGLDYLNALTSENGLTEEKHQQILQGAIHSLPYALFGAYVSGPLGDKIVASLQNSDVILPTILKTAFSKGATGAGFTAEVGLDVVFESALSDGEFMEIIRGNVQGESQGRVLNHIMQMVAGGRAHGASKMVMENAGLDGYTIKQIDNDNYEIKTPDGTTHKASQKDFTEVIAHIFNRIGNDIKYSKFLINNIRYKYENPELAEKLANETVERYGKTERRFSKYDIQKIDKAYTKNPELINKILSYTKTNDKGNIVPRFDGYDISFVIKAFEKNPKLAEKLANYKCEYNGKLEYRFSGSDIGTIVESHSIAPKYTEKLIDLTYKYENVTRPRFKSYEIKTIIEAYSKNPELVEKLINDTLDSNNETTPRFSGYFILDIIDAHKEKPELIERLINEKDKDRYRFSDYDIKDLIETHKKMPELTERLLDYAIIREGKSVPQFEAYNIEEIAKLYDENPELVTKLVNETITEKNGPSKARFGNFDIEKISEAYAKDPNFVVKLIDYKYVDTDGKSRPRFDSNDINMLTIAYEEYPELTIKLIDKSYTTKDNRTRPSYNGTSIAELVKTYKINPEFTEKLINCTEPNFQAENVPRFDSSQISSLIDCHKDNPELTEKLVDATKTNKNGILIPKFHSYEIEKIVKLSKDNPELMATLVDFTKNNNKGVTETRFNVAEIEVLFKEFKEKPEVFNELTTWIKENPDLETGNILTLYHTQLKLNQEIENEANTKDKKIKIPPVQTSTVKSEAMIKVENRLVEIGLHPKMAENYVKLCHTNGIVDSAKANSICNLVEAFTYRNEKSKLIVGVSPKDVENILELATGHQLSTQNGKFREKFVTDIAKLKECGVDDIKLAINISAIINMEDIELKARLNTKVREDVVKRFKELPQSVLEELKPLGLDIETLEAKALQETKGGKVNKDNKTVKATVRTLDSIVGVEKVVLNKFKSEVPQEIWQDPDRFKAWAEEKVQTILDFEKNPDYIATGDYAKFNDARKEGVESWYKFLKEESNYKDDVFVHLLVMDGITKEMKPNNAVTPPAVSSGTFEATYNALLQADTKVSFSKTYAQQTKQRAIQTYTKETVSLNGVEGRWVTIPRSQKGEPKYNEHIAMVQALAEGSSWCLRFENAHNYLQGGNLHFFVDTKGNSQVAINETDGRITQIQKRYDQDSTVPVAYSEVISKWAKDNNYNGHEWPIANALEAKPKFDELKTKLSQLMQEENYEEVFKTLNFEYSVADDGTYILHEYKPKYHGQYTLNDLGVDENKLLQKVSQFNCSVRLDGSNVTALPNLRVINGELDLGDCKVKDFRSLESLNGQKINWIKKKAEIKNDTVETINGEFESNSPEKVRILEDSQFETSEPKPLSIGDENIHTPKSLIEPGSTKPQEQKLKSTDILTPSIKADELEKFSKDLTKEVFDAKTGKTKRVLTAEAEALVYKTAIDIRQNALDNESKIVKSLKDAGLDKQGELEHRSKSLHSIQDKLRNYLIENPEKTYEDAIREVRDGVALRTVNQSQDVSKHPDVVELLEKGDVKSAVNKAIELQSQHVLDNLMSIIDKMADGSADFSISRINNYMGEDGIPYFTESQLNKLRIYAQEKGIEIPVVSRVIDPAERVADKDIYSSNATTKIRKSGYTALQLNFVTKDGDVFEWQYRGDKLNPFGEGEHIPYDLRTGKDIIGKNTILTDLYKPLQDLLTNRDIMPDTLYKEYNAYLTAHYRYLREVELGFALPDNPPKLPQGIDSRLRADNLELLHDIGEKLKKGELTSEEAMKEYNSRLIQNDESNVTNNSYIDNLKRISDNANIDRYEALLRLNVEDDAKNRDVAILAKACMDSQGNIKNNLVILAEKFKQNDIANIIIADFINRFKDENGEISNEILNNFQEFTQIHGKSLNPTARLALYTAINDKNGVKLLNDTQINQAITIAKKMSDVFAIKEINDFIQKNNLDNPHTFITLLEFHDMLKKGNRQTHLTNKEFKPILDTIINKDGEIDFNSMDLAISLSKTTIRKENIANIILSAKNSDTQELDKTTYNFLQNILSNFDNKFINTNSTQILISRVITSIKSVKTITDSNGKTTKYAVNDEKLMNEFVELYKKLPKQPNEDMNVKTMLKTATVLRAIKNADGTIDQQKLKIAGNMLKCKFTLNSITEILSRCLTKDGSVDSKNLSLFVVNYNNLSLIDKNNLTSVDLALEHGNLRQTMNFKDGSIKVFDIDTRMVSRKNEYDIETKVAKNNPSQIHQKLRDAVRGKSTKTISKNGRIMSEVTILYDKDGNKIGSEYVSRNSFGMLDVRFRDNDGNTHILSETKIDNDGNLVIKKDFISLDGSRTTHDYKEYPNGSFESEYIITDETSNTITHEIRTYTKLDDKHYKTSFNGNSYDIKIDEFNILTVTNDKGEKVRFDLDDFTNKQLPVFENLIKEIPGHEFFNIAKTKTVAIGPSQNPNNAHYSPKDNSINLGRNDSSFATFLHEFGHNKDWKLDETGSKMLRTDPEIQKTYLEEREAFVKEFSTAQRDMVNYFISLDNPNSRTSQGISEVIAETNAILTTPHQANGLEFRKYYLQRYFPKTISVIAKKLNPDIYNN